MCLLKCEWKRRAKRGTAYECEGHSLEFFCTIKLYTQQDQALELFSKHKISEDLCSFSEGYYEKHTSADEERSISQPREHFLPS